MPDTISTRIVIEGRVQGVWYRGWTVDTATALGLKGWVRNRHDGTVEAVLCGPAENVRAMIEKCHKGPLLARVRGVHEHATEPFNGDGFEQRPTA